MVLEKTLESPLDCKEIQPVHSEGDQPWDFFGRSDAKAETPVLWPPHVKSWLIGKDSDVGRDWGQEEKGTMEDEMAGWHQRLDGHKFEWTPGVGDGQGGPACCNSWGCKELDTTERLNWTELNWNGKINKILKDCYSSTKEISESRTRLSVYTQWCRGRGYCFIPFLSTACSSFFLTPGWSMLPQAILRKLNPFIFLHLDLKT